MTDLLDETLDDLTSTAETKPKAAEKLPDVTSCRYCSKTFDSFGPARYFQRGAHEKKDHHEQWLAAKAGVKPTKKTAKKPAAKAKPAKSTVVNSKRIPVSESVTRNLGRLSKMVLRVDVPLGRALQFSAPATGSAVDEVVAGTYVDRKVIQPLAGYADKWEKFGGVIAFPVMIALCSRNPEMFPLLEDDLRDATLDVLIASIPTFEKRAAREKKAVDALRRLGQVDERYATTDDPIGLILRDIFAPAEQTESDGAAE
jgi:hypothetical protein